MINLTFSVYAFNISYTEIKLEYPPKIVVSFLLNMMFYYLKAFCFNVFFFFVFFVNKKLRLKIIRKKALRGSYEKKKKIKL